MQSITGRSPYICTRCRQARALRTRNTLRTFTRTISSPSTRGEGTQGSGKDGLQNIVSADRQEEGSKKKGRGALSQRLEQLSEDAAASGGAATKQAINEAIFDKDLRRELEERIAKANFRNAHSGAIAQANLPEHVGAATRELAGSKPWAGDEAMEDTARRMLSDAYKPLKVPLGNGSVVRTPVKVDTGRPTRGSGNGQRLVNARDRSSHYNFMKDAGMSEAEREQMRKQLKARFEPSGRNIPATIQGLTSLANERIEDAIARGQFKNLPRGMKIERDYNASSPFIDTTEYLLNKMIQKQDIVPPWIEKQQELVSTANKFRARLRNDWKRHAARSIGSRGGSLDEQIRTAQTYATAELLLNPAPSRTTEKLNTVDSVGHASQITLTGQLKLSSDGKTPVEDVDMKQTKVDEKTLKPLDATEATAEAHLQITEQVEEAANTALDSSPPSLELFRDPQWLAAEQSFLKHSVEHLNTLTRSYNLMAPDLAKKPYYSLERELKAMYRDVAHQLPDAIRERALAPKQVKVELSSGRSGVFPNILGDGHKGKVYDESSNKRYGLKEFWRDLFAKEV